MKKNYTLMHNTPWKSTLVNCELRTVLQFLNIVVYTGCNRRNGPNFGRVFLMLNYTEKTQNTYVQS